MNNVLPFLIWFFTLLASLAMWGFFLVSAYGMFVNGVSDTQFGLLLLCTIIFTVLVAVCEIFAIILVRLTNLNFSYAIRNRDTDNERSN